jgi:hypothetical protein
MQDTHSALSSHFYKSFEIHIVRGEVAQATVARRVQTCGPGFVVLVITGRVWKTC